MHARVGSSAGSVVFKGRDAALPTVVCEGAVIDIRYGGYLARPQQQIEQGRRQQGLPIPSGIDYSAISTLSAEAREKLAAIQPLSLGQAARIPGVSPADVQALLLWLELRRRREGLQVETAQPRTTPVQ